MDKFNTEQIDKVDYAALKQAVEGVSLLPMIAYKKQVGDRIQGKRDAVIEKGQVFRKEHKLAAALHENLKNSHFGFRCLHYIVSESSGALTVIVLNKAKKAGKVGIRTKDGDA